MSAIGKNYADSREGLGDLRLNLVENLYGGRLQALELLTVEG